MTITASAPVQPDSIVRRNAREVREIRETHSTVLDVQAMTMGDAEGAWALFDADKDVRLAHYPGAVYMVTVKRAKVARILFVMHRPATERATEVTPDVVTVEGPRTDQATEQADVITTDADEFQGYRLDADQLAATRAKIDKINARAAARGLDGRLVVEATKHVHTEDRAGFKVDVTSYLTKITGAAPKLPDWEFVATLDWDPNAGLIVRTLPGVESVSRQGLEDARCAHCLTNVTRLKTYLLRNRVTGAQMQVGSTCIKDFLGWSASVSFLDKGPEGLYELGSGFVMEYTPLDVVKVAWAAIQRFGWVPKSSYDGCPTVSYVRDVLYPPKGGKAAIEAAKLAADLAPYVAEADARAREIIAFIGSDEFAGHSEYVTNLKALVSGMRVSSRYIGMVVSAPAAWARHREREIIRKAKEAKDGVSAYVGNVKERLTMTATVESIRYFDGDYGTRYLVMLRDENGNLLKWWASTDTAEEFEGKAVKIKGTVKAHETYKDVAMTVLSRVAFLD